MRKTAAELAGAALLRAVLDDPADDLPRLAYADWLDEQGQDDRADYIRLEVAGVNTATFSRSWPDRCWPDSFGALTTPAGVGEPESRGWAWEWRRGFVAEVSCPLAEWLAHGPALAAGHPLEEVRVTDREPTHQEMHLHPWAWWASGGGWHRRGRFERPARRHVLRAELWQRLGGHDHGDEPGRFKAYHTREGALAALSRACVAWARDGRRHARRYAPLGPDLARWHAEVPR